MGHPAHQKCPYPLHDSLDPGSDRGYFVLDESDQAMPSSEPAGHGYPVVVQGCPGPIWLSPHTIRQRAGPL